MKDELKEVKVSVKYASSIHMKSKTFVLFLRKPGMLEVYGPDINNMFPMIIKFDDNKTETVFKYTENEFWNFLKEYKKNIRKKKN